MFRLLLVACLFPLAAIAGDRITIIDANGRRVVIEDGQPPIYLPPQPVPGRDVAPAPRARVAEEAVTDRTYVLRGAIPRQVIVYDENSPVYVPTAVRTRVVYAPAPTYYALPVAVVPAPAPKKYATPVRDFFFGR